METLVDIFLSTGWVMFGCAYYALRQSEIDKRDAENARKIEERRQTAQTNIDRFNWMNRVMRGPWRDKPELDVEFYNSHGAPVSSAKTDLHVAVNRYGVVVHGRCLFTAHEDMEISGCSVWFGDDYHYFDIVNKTINQGDMFQQDFAVPVSLQGGITNIPWQPPEEHAHGSVSA
jgi:hypothetical protein